MRDIGTNNGDNMQVTYIDHMGTDLSVVNAARVSFGKLSEWDSKYVGSYSEYEELPDRDSWTIFDEFCDPYDGYGLRRLRPQDQGLIQFLARGCTSGDWERHIDALFTTMPRDDIDAILKYVKRMPDHWTPFGHTAITLHIKAPIFVARQLGKHQVGFVWNEVSRRYVTDDPTFFIPQEFRKAAANVKQGSSDETTDWGVHSYVALCNKAVDLYKDMLEMGVCPEQARMVLPQSMYTEWYWTGNLYGFANVFIQRTDSHAQREVQDVAHQIGQIIEPLFPVSWKALTK